MIVKGTSGKPGVSILGPTDLWRLAVEVAGKTDVGCVRANNEDNFGFDSRYGIFVVCDGMGGQAAGEVASKMGVDILLDYFRKQPPADSAAADQGQKKSGADTLASAIQLANRTIFHAGQEQNGRNGMGSTIVAALVRGNSLAIAHVGDSRIYLVRQGLSTSLRKTTRWSWSRCVAATSPWSKRKVGDTEHHSSRPRARRRPWRSIPKSWWRCRTTPAHDLGRAYAARER